MAPPQTPPAAVDVEREVLELGRELARNAGRARHASWAMQDRAMARLSRDPQVRAALFRLVDVAPACDGPVELAAHLNALLAAADHRPRTLRAVSRASVTPGLSRVTGWAASAAVRRMAHRFIVGETPAAASDTPAAMWSRGAAISLDLLGEATVTSEEGRAYAARCETALEQFSAAAASWPVRPVLEADAAGPLPRANLSVKVTALTPLVRGEAPERGREDAAVPLRHLLRRARDLGAHLHVDTESMDSRDMVFGLVLDLLSEPEFESGPSAGVVVQAYLRDSDAIMDRVLEWAARTPRRSPLTVRLVKGAYWDHETIEAAQRGWTPPVFTDKAGSDRSFERLTRRLIEAFPLVRPAIASHNLRSIAHAIVVARRAGLRNEDFELQVLRGLGDDLQAALTDQGLRARVYCPVGDLVAGMAYLVRRLLENTSNDSFLASRQSGADLDRLLAAP